MTRIKMPYEKGPILVLNPMYVEDLRKVVRDTAGVMQDGVGISGYLVSDTISVIHGGLSGIAKEVHSISPKHPLFYKPSRQWASSQHPSLAQLRDWGVDAVVHTFDSTETERTVSVLQNSASAGIGIVFEARQNDLYHYIVAANEGVTSFVVPPFLPVTRLVHSQMIKTVKDPIFFTAASNTVPVDHATLAVLGSRWHVFMPDTVVRPLGTTTRNRYAIHDAALELVIRLNK